MSTPKSSPRKPPLSNSPLRPSRPTFASISGSHYDDEPSASASVRDQEEDEIDELASEDEEPPPGKSGARKEVRCKWADCGLMLHDQPTLVSHLQEEHFQPGKDSYSCQWEGCARQGVRQATRHSLVTHVRAHTGERPYTCPQPGCGSTFTRSDAMSKHLRTLHNLPLEETNGRGVRKSKPVKNEMDTSGQYPPAPASAAGEGASEMAFSEIGDGEPGDGTYKPGGKKGKGSKAKPRASAAAAAAVGVGAGKGGGKGRGKGRGAKAGSPSTSLTRTDQDLLEDEDMENVLHRIRYRQQFWNVTAEDKKAMEYVRSLNPRKAVTDLEEDDEDDFDEGITAGANPGVVGVLQDDRGEEVEVLGRSKWQTRYIMAKVKLMLVEEENMMRKSVLEKLMAHEAKLKEDIEKEGYEWGV